MRSIALTPLTPSLHECLSVPRGPGNLGQGRSQAQPIELPLPPLCSPPAPPPIGPSWRRCHAHGGEKEINRLTRESWMQAEQAAQQGQEGFLS